MFSALAQAVSFLCLVRISAPSYHTMVCVVKCIHHVGLCLGVGAVLGGCLTSAHAPRGGREQESERTG